MLSIDLSIGDHEHTGKGITRWKILQIVKKAFSDLKHGGDWAFLVVVSMMHLSRDPMNPIRLARLHLHTILYAEHDAEHLAQKVKEAWVRTAKESGYNVDARYQITRGESEPIDAGKVIYSRLQELHSKTYGYIRGRKAKKRDIIRIAEQLLEKAPKRRVKKWRERARKGNEQMMELLTCGNILTIESYEGIIPLESAKKFWTNLKLYDPEKLHAKNLRSLNLKGLKRLIER